MTSGGFLKLKVTALRKTLPIWGMLWIVILRLSIPCLECCVLFIVPNSQGGSRADSNGHHHFFDTPVNRQRGALALCTLRAHILQGEGDAWAQGYCCADL